MACANAQFMGAAPAVLVSTPIPRPQSSNWHTGASPCASDHCWYGATGHYWGPFPEYAGWLVAAFTIRKQRVTPDWVTGAQIMTTISTADSLAVSLVAVILIGELMSLRGL